MSESLADIQLELLLPVLPQVASVVSRTGTLDGEVIADLLRGSGLNEDWAVREVTYWGQALAMVHREDDLRTRQLARRSLLLRGIPETDVHQAVIAARAAIPNQELSPQRRIVTGQDRLDFGWLAPSQIATGRLQVQGGPGQATVNHPAVQVTPPQFGSRSAELQIMIQPVESGELTASLHLTTVWDTKEIPLPAHCRPAAGPVPWDIARPMGRFLTGQPLAVEVAEDPPYPTRSWSWLAVIVALAVVTSATLTLVLLLASAAPK